MRWLAITVLAIVVAGCAEPSASQGPEDPLAQKEIKERRAPPDEPVTPENVSMDPVFGNVAADGFVHQYCGPLSGGGWAGWSYVPWQFKVGTNATSMSVTAQWTPTNPTIETLDFVFYWQDAVIGLATTTPGGTFQVDASDVALDDRAVLVQIAPPVCQSDPVAYRYYEGVTARLDVKFLE